MAKQQYTEQELIEGCKRGKRKFQELLYKRFYAFGMSICLRYAYGRDDALEILNDSFMKVFDHIREFDQNRPFKAWFRRILVNTALDHYRLGRRHRLCFSLEELEAEYGDVVLQISGDDADQAFTTGFVLSLFDSLPEAYRMVFNMYEVEGYSHDEIAAMLDVSPGTSRSTLSRAKKMLRILYAKMMNEASHEAV